MTRRALQQVRAEKQRRRRDGRHKRWCARDGRPPRNQRRQANAARREQIHGDLLYWGGTNLDADVELRLRTIRESNPWKGQHRSRDRR